MIGFFQSGIFDLETKNPPFQYVTDSETSAPQVMSIMRERPRNLPGPSGLTLLPFPQNSSLGLHKHQNVHYVYGVTVILVQWITLERLL